MYLFPLLREIRFLFPRRRINRHYIIPKLETNARRIKNEGIAEGTGRGSPHKETALNILFAIHF